jgi:hypothetical protein
LLSFLFVMGRRTHGVGRLHQTPPKPRVRLRAARDVGKCQAHRNNFCGGPALLAEGKDFYLAIQEMTALRL